MFGAFRLATVKGASPLKAITLGYNVWRYVA